MLHPPTIYGPWEEALLRHPHPHPGPTTNVCIVVVLGQPVHLRVAVVWVQLVG